MSEENTNFIRKEIERLSPFLHNVKLPFGLQTIPENTARRPDCENSRLMDLINAIIIPLENKLGSFIDMSFIEVACNCGGLAFEFAKRNAKKVLGTDITSHYIEQAQFISNALNIENIEFQVASIDDTKQFGSFDVSICCGLLYHLENPVSSLRALTQATNRIMVLDTQVLVGEEKPIWLSNVKESVNNNHLLASTGLWRENEIIQFRPSVPAVKQLLKFLGFKHIEVLPIDTNHPSKPRRNGAVRTFIAEK